jgi:hypothetical protein
MLGGESVRPHDQGVLWQSEFVVKMLFVGFVERTVPFAVFNTGAQAAAMYQQLLNSHPRCVGVQDLHAALYGVSLVSWGTQPFQNDHHLPNVRQGQERLPDLPLRPRLW